METTIIGSERQQRWAKQILGPLIASEFHLPTYVNASIVIDNRHLSPDELAKLLREQPYSSPFTAAYPRNTKDLAIATLKTLPKKCVVIDFESSGLEKDAEIVEIGLVELENEKNTARTFVKPFDLASYSGSMAEEINGIKATQLLNAPTLVTVWPNLQSIIGEYHILTYNADYDIRLLRASLQIWNIQAPHLTATCIMKIATAFYERDYFLSLSEAALLAGIDASAYGSAHTALNDAKVARHILIKMIKEVQNEKI